MSGEPKRAVLRAFWRLARAHGSPLPVAWVRREAGLSKALFDAAALALMREGVAYMAEHDHAGRLTDAEREELVYGGEERTSWGGRKPVYYCSFSLRGYPSWRKTPDGWRPERMTADGRFEIVELPDE